MVGSMTKELFWGNIASSTKLVVVHGAAGWGGKEGGPNEEDGWIRLQ